MDFDILVIGGGPGGYTAAIKAGQLGAKVGIVEKGALGGTCLNWGCIPTKALYKNAELMRSFSNAESFGIRCSDFEIDFPKVRERKREIVGKLVKGVDSLLKANKVEQIEGLASFIDEKTDQGSYNDEIKSQESCSPGKKVQVSLADGSTEIYRARNIIIATGSEASIPPLEGINLPGVLTAKQLLETDEIPKSLVIIGGGVIGMEFASIFTALGTEVKVIEALPNILTQIDRDITKRLAPLLKRQGMEIHTSTKVKKIAAKDGGLCVSAEGKRGELEITAEKVLIAVGRKANFAGLNIEKIGLETEKGALKVDKNYESNVEGVFAIGDVNGQVMLAHAAAHQGRQVVQYLLEKKEIEELLIPSCVFMFPEIAAVGMTEEVAKELEIEYKTSRFLVGANSKAMTLGEPEGLVKVICDADNYLIGVHIMGAHASDLIGQGVLAIKEKMKVEDFTNIVFAHPTLAESLDEAILGINNEAIHMIPRRVPQKRTKSK